MYCKKCGSKIDDDSLFCESCGTNLKDYINRNENQIDDLSYNGNDVSVNSNYKTITIIIISSVLILMIMILIFLIYIKNNYDNKISDNTDQYHITVITTTSTRTTTESPIASEIVTTSAITTEINSTTTEEVTTHSNKSKETSTAKGKVNYLIEPQNKYMGVEEGDIYSYSGDDIHLFYGPDESDYEITEIVIHKSDYIQEHGRNNNGKWLYVSLLNNDECGWIRNKYLTEIVEPPELTNYTEYISGVLQAKLIKDADFKNGPSEKRDYNNYVHKLEKGKDIWIQGKGYNWYYIGCRSGGGTLHGWIKKECVEINETSTTTSKKITTTNTEVSPTMTTTSTTRTETTLPTETTTTTTFITPTETSSITTTIPEQSDSN